jgi:hypothetical protein
MMDAQTQPSITIPDEAVVAALNARWHTLHKTSWTPKWSSSDKKAMRAAIETALVTINAAKTQTL